MLLATVGVALSMPGQAQDVYGPWQVRRGRTTDASRSGGFPTWTVTFTGPKETPDVRIDGDEAGAARGTILVGRRVRIEEDRLWSLSLAVATFCNDRNRRGGLEILMVAADAWDRLATDPNTPDIFDARDAKVCLARVPISSHVGEDVVEPMVLDPTKHAWMAATLPRFVGRDVVLALAWTGFHGSEEWAMLKELKLVQIEPADALQALFDRLDLDRPGLEHVRDSVRAQDNETAATALAAYFRDRRAPAVPGDPRLREEHTITARRLEEADAALENRFIGQSKYGLQQVPADIDWSFNPTKDPEWTWQFNRHSAWRALGAAYLATGDEKYAVKWVSLMRDWVAENPPGTRLSWRTLEAGIRASGWLNVYFSFVGSPSFTPLDQAVFLMSFADHADYLLPEGHFRSGSNWGQTESLGLLNLGSFLPEFSDAKLWRETGWRRLEGEMFKQVLEDGAQVELTTSYHQGTISGFVRSADIARLGGTEPSEAYWKRLERMYEYTMVLQKPDGSQPMLGDSWPGNSSSTVRAGGKRFDRPDMTYVGTDGRDGAEPSFLDAALPSAGYYVMRTGWVDDQAIYLLTDVAHRWGGGHQQPDALQVNLYAYGKTLLPDSGSFLYYGPGRSRFARTSSHATITIDDSNQNRSAAKLNCFFSSDALSVVDGAHQGYEGVTHRRQVLFSRPTADALPYAVVIDRVSGIGEHQADLYYHFLPTTLAAEPGQLRARTTMAEGPNLLVQSLPQEGLTMAEVPSAVSFVYTKEEPRPAVQYSRYGALPFTFVTLLLPYPGRQAPAVAIRELTVTGEHDPIAVEVTGPGFVDVLFAGVDVGPVKGPGFEAVGLAGLLRKGADGADVGITCVAERGIHANLRARWEAQ